MRKIYKLPRAHPAGRLATIALALVVLALVGLASQLHPGSGPALAAAPAPAPAATDAAAPTVYFPSQYTLHAGEPEAHIEAF